jgi:hypothetical protein
MQRHHNLVKPMRQCCRRRNTWQAWVRRADLKICFIEVLRSQPFICHLADQGFQVKDTPKFVHLTGGSILYYGTALRN